MFEHFTPYGGDPILSLYQDFLKDTRPIKANLSIGVYLDESGRLPVLKAVQQAISELAAQGLPSSYLPMEGAADYISAVQAQVFGADCEALQQGRIATVQTVGGTGALRLCAELLHENFGSPEVWVSGPTWDNHSTIFEGCGFEVKAYPYYDAATGALDFPGMLAQLERVPQGSIVVLHACCHNPTGLDLDKAQWDALLPVLQARGLIVVLDMAYQGFGSNVDDDAYCVRRFAQSGLSFFVANSFSKNFSLYGERCGALSVVCASKAVADLVLGRLRFTIRRNYSSPPAQGSRIIARVLRDDTLRKLWLKELDDMRERIQSMRTLLLQELTRLQVRKDWSFLTRQRGMFSYTGLATAQVHALRSAHGFYLLDSGRMCLAGLNHGNVRHVAQALADLEDRG